MSPNPEMVARAAENRPRNPIRGLDFTESLMLEANMQNKIIIRMLTTKKVHIKKSDVQSLPNITTSNFLRI